MPSAYDPEDLEDKEKLISPEQANEMESWYHADSPKDKNSAAARDERSLQQLTKIKPSVGGVFKFAKTNRGKLIIGGASAGIITLVIIGFFALLPLKILHIVNNLQNRFFATSESAVSKETNVLFSNYIKQYVLPGINNCKGGTINAACTPREIQPKTLISKLYNGWKTGHLENKIAEKYGLVFESRNGHYFMKAPGLSSDGVNIDEFKTPNESLDDFIGRSGKFNPASRAQLRSAVRDALDGETRYKKVMYRFKVGRLLEQKYGIRRCIFFCQASDKFADWKNSKKNAAKIVLTQKVLQPRNEMVGYVIECIFSDTGCDLSPAPKRTTVTAEGCQSECLLNGEPISTTESEIRQKLTAYAAQEGFDSAETIAKAEALYKDISDKGYANYLTKQFIEKVVMIATGTGTEKAGKAASAVGDKAGVIGLVFMAGNLTSNIDNAGPNLKRLSYVINTTTMATTFSMYRTYADEIKTGHVDAALVGSMTNSLGPGNQNADYSNDVALGGTAGAEQSPAYGLLIGKGSGSVPTGLQATHTTGFVTAANALHHNPEWRVIADAAHVVHDVSKALNSVLAEVLKPIAPALNFLLGNVFNLIKPFEGLATPLAQYLENYILPAPLVTTNTSGSQMFGVMAGGADVAGNDFAHNGLGGKVLSANELTAIVDQQNQQLQNYKSQSLFARIFDTSSDKSLVSKLAVAMPSSAGDAVSKVTSLFTSNPLPKIARSFGSVFNPARVSAAAPSCTSDRYTLDDSGNGLFYWAADPAVDAHGGRIVTTHSDGSYDIVLPSGEGQTFQAPNYCDPAAIYAGDPYHILQYGYPANDPELAKANADPEAYWNANCVGDPPPKTNSWNQDATTKTNLDPNTKMPANRDGTNPCLLIEASVGSAGALYDSSLLTTEDQGGP